MLHSRADHGKPRPRVLRIQLFRNGDVNFKGVFMKFETKKYNSFTTFLEDVTSFLKKNVFINEGGVQGLYTASGSQVTSLSQLKDNGVYAAAKFNEPFKDGYYNRNAAPRPPPTPTSASFTSRASILSACSTKSLNKPYMQAGDIFVAKKITIVRAGNRPRKILRILLNNRNAHSFEAAMSEVNEAIKFDSAPMHSLYTLSGKLVSNLNEIFGRHFIFFAFRKEAICLEKDFQLTEDEVKTVLQLNRPPNSDKISLKKPPPKEVENIKVLPQIALKYELSKRIGTGRYSSIHMCSVKTFKGTKYAMKIAHKNKATYESLNQELLMLKELRHPNIVRLTHHIDSASEVYFILELLDRDLKTLLNDEGKLREDEVKLIMTDVLSALFYLHCLKVVHRGVSTSNVMVKAVSSGVRTAKLIDFGSACRTFGPMLDVCGETAFMAPEMVGQQGYGEKVDVWAAGVVLYCMLTLTKPFLGRSEDEDRRLIVEERYDTASEAWAKVSGDAKHIIGRMLCKNPEKRFSADALLSHSWITGVSIDEFGNFTADLFHGDTDSADSVEESPARTKKGVGARDFKPKERDRSKIPARQECQSNTRCEDGEVQDDGSEWEDDVGVEAFDCSEYELDFEGDAGDGDTCSD